MISNDILLLKIIQSKGSIYLLRDRGLSHSQIAMLIHSHQSNGNIEITNNDIQLTQKGKDILQSNLDKIYPRVKEQWIVPQEHHYKKPISFDTIILPKKKEL